MLHRHIIRACCCLLILILALSLAGCAGVRWTATQSTPMPNQDDPGSSPTTSFDPGLPTALQSSVAVLRNVSDSRVTGAAIIVTSDGFLLTDSSALSNDTEVLLPGGRAMRPVPVASESTANLTLLKVAAGDLIPARLAEKTISDGDEVFIAGYDASGSIVGQIGGHVRAISPLSGISVAIPSLIETDIPITRSIGGGPLSDSGGAMVGLVVASDRNGGMARALTERYLIDWFDRWRDSAQQLTGESVNWPVLTVPGLLSMHYPSGWSAKTDSSDPNAFFAELVPSDPDAALRLAVSIQPSSPPADPIAFANKEFGGKKNAAIWGAVQYGGYSGVRVILDQEGARIDTVYLFGSGRRIAFSMTSGYGSDDTLPQAERAAALYEATLLSIAPIPPAAQ
ncbi:MAG TPA: serine protease [Nitrolancea sp.]|nr:serine protease [Nitrolancea sp.]